MRHLGKLWDAFSLVSSVRDAALERRRYSWQVTLPNTLHLEAEYADIRLVTRERPTITAKVALPLGIGWQLAAEQDDAGVYIVAMRKPLIGSLGRARFDIALPPGLHITLKLRRCQLRLDDLDMTLELPPSPVIAE